MLQDLSRSNINVVTMRYLFNLVHFPEGDYPGKITQRQSETISERELSERFKFPERIATRSQKIAKRRFF